MTYGKCNDVEIQC